MADQGQHLDGLARWLGAVVTFLRAAGPLPTPAHTNTDISSLPYKTPCIFYREGMILPVFACLLYLSVNGLFIIEGVGGVCGVRRVVAG